MHRHVWVVALVFGGVACVDDPLTGPPDASEDAEELREMVNEAIASGAEVNDGPVPDTQSYDDVAESALLSLTRDGSARVEVVRCAGEMTLERPREGRVIVFVASGRARRAEP